VPAFDKYFFELVLSAVLPFVQEYMNIENVLSLWEDGQSIGLAGGQRLKHLGKLKQLLERQKSIRGIE
jgi:hypothetical protein